jgi:hypothetical protein
MGKRTYGYPQSTRHVLAAFCSVVSCQPSSEAIVKTCGSRFLGSFRLGVLTGSFDEFAVDESRSGTDQGDKVGAFTARQRSCADSMSLNAIASPAAHEPRAR